jgi:hypothetical protein
MPRKNKNLKNFEAIISKINSFLQKHNEKITILEIDPLDYLKLIQHVTQTPNNLPIVVSTTGRKGEFLIRWVHYDVQFVIDNRKSGGVGITGKNAQQVLNLLDL